MLAFVLAYLVPDPARADQPVPEQAWKFPDTDPVDPTQPSLPEGETTQ